MSRPGGIDVAQLPGRRGGVLLVLGLVALLAGIGGLAHGIVETVRQAASLRDDAVAEGTVAFAPGESVPFESRERGLAVYLDFDGRTNLASVRDDAQAATVCEISTTDGRTRTIRGNRQGMALTLGDLQSVGSFDMPTAAGRVGCRFLRPRVSFQQPRGLPWILTPHKTTEGTGSILIIIGGAAVAGLGGCAAVAGLLRIRRRQRLRSL